MNFKCLICSDLFVASADISTTPCGHLFHCGCLLQWLERSRSCPQCRTKTTESNVHRVFISVEDHPSNLDDVATLQNSIDNLQFQLKMKSMDYDQTKEKLKVSKDQTLGLRREVKDLEDKIRVLDSAIHALKEQIKYFKSKSQESDRFQEDVKVLRNKISELEHVQLVINGSREQVNDMLRSNRDPHSLIVLVSTLKKELIDSDRKKKQIQVMLKDSQVEVQAKLQELTMLSKKNSKLKRDVEAHKNCDTEREYLKKKLNELQAASARRDSTPCNNTLSRILLESPVPLPKDKYSSPSLPEKIQSIKDSDSPYLRVQSSSIGLADLMNFNYHSAPKKPSIFKHPTLKVENIRKPSTSVSYDGLGGHSKDEHFPTDRSQIGNTKKRPNSATSIPSAKLRKLAPQQKIDKFFHAYDDPM